MHSVKFPCGWCHRKIRLEYASFVVRSIPFCNKAHYLAWEQGGHYEEITADAVPEHIHSNGMYDAA